MPAARAGTLETCGLAFGAADPLLQREPLIQMILVYRAGRLQVFLIGGVLGSVLSSPVEYGLMDSDFLRDVGRVVRGALRQRPERRLLGLDGRPAFAFAGPRTLDDASRWELRDVARVGGDVRLELEQSR